MNGLSQRWLIDSAGLDTVTGLFSAVLVGALSHAVMAAGGRYQSNLQSDLADRVDVKVNEDVLNMVANVPTIEHLERPDYLDRISVLRRGTHSLAAVGWRLADAAAAVASILLSLWLLIGVHPTLALLAILAVPPLWAASRGQRIIRRARDASAQHERREEALHDLFVNPARNKEIRIAGAGHILSDEAAASWEERNLLRTTAELRATMWQLVGWLCYAGGFGMTLALVVKMAAGGEASVGDLALVLALGMRMRWQVRVAVDTFMRLAEAGQATNHFWWLTSYAAKRRNAAADEPPSALREGVVLKDVSFTYPGAKKPALDAIDLTLSPGRTVALVGDNGAGKTTLVKLLTGMYLPDQGSVTVEGASLDTLDAAAWRTRTSATYQDFVKFEVPVRDAVAIGRLNPAVSPEVIDDALARAGAAHFTERLPEGIHTQLGLVHEGVELSHGQWQRIALARALVRTGALLLVLDEPTAALDPQAEQDLYERFTKETRACPGRITVLVSHRFSTVHMADEIVVMDSGRVTECGTHQELMANQGRYADLFAKQANGYSDTEKAPSANQEPI
ncbi:ABC transporter ATP-binding protein [Streptomyces natalensis]|uniref:ABC transporter ATP-binding protein n=1 Tax=Streptomyces natalensis TaxID=68242 RepID=UPI000689C9FD|nr:ABC transporter ATP-binding protein [Streptomyces natalensis]